MNFSRPEHIAITENRDSTCIKCLTDQNTTRRLSIVGMGYGSCFDNYDTDIVLCDQCYNQSEKEIWSNIEVIAFSDCGHDFYKLKYEDEIMQYIDECPLAGQELVWNNVSGWMENSQTWIDEELDRQTEHKLYELQSQHTRNIELNANEIIEIINVLTEQYSVIGTHDTDNILNKMQLAYESIDRQIIN